MKTVDVRLLVHDDVDEQFLVEQLVSASSGPGSPVEAVQVEVVDQYSDGRLEPIGRVTVTLDHQRWNGEYVAPGGLTT